MAKNTSILLGDYFDKYIQSQVQSGRYSASEVIRAALRMFEKEDNKKKELIQELKIGEKSGFNEDFNKNEFMKSLPLKYTKNEI